MAYDRFLIAPLNTGWQNDVKPWLTPDDSFQTLNNAYVWRGRVRKRFGGEYTGLGAPAGMGSYYSRLAINLPKTDDNGDATGFVGGHVWKSGQAFTIGTDIFTVISDAPGAQDMQTNSTTATVFTYDVTSGAYKIQGSTHTTDIYFYPSTPVMGITNYQVGPVNDQPSFAFDTQFSYTYTGNRWQVADAVQVWHGNDHQFFWSTNWLGLLPGENAIFTTNFNATVGTPTANDDDIFFWDNTTATWEDFSVFTVFQSAVGGIAPFPFVSTALMIFPFKGHLLLLNTIENDGVLPYLTASKNTQFAQRCRYSHYGSPFVTNAWLEPNASITAAPFDFRFGDGGGYIDAATDEAIVSAEFIKDRLIVYFEESTWEIVYTGNEVMPFCWQKINTELGSQSTFSTVPFDKMVLTIGNVGVHACTGANVERIDGKYPTRFIK